MRLSSSLLKGARTPQKEHQVPFQAILPLALKPKVSGKGQNTSNVTCLQEMALLFACLKDHEFNDQLCNKEIQQFQTCYKASVQQKILTKELEAKGSVGVNVAAANSLTINRVLKRFPPKSS